MMCGTSTRRLKENKDGNHTADIEQQTFSPAETGYNQRKLTHFLSSSSEVRSQSSKDRWYGGRLTGASNGTTRHGLRLQTLRENASVRLLLRNGAIAASEHQFLRSSFCSAGADKLLQTLVQTLSASAMRQTRRLVGYPSRLLQRSGPSDELIVSGSP